MTEELPPVDGRPRPQLWRDRARSLDGTWDFAADPQGSWDIPAQVPWQKSIEVPFSPGTPASGVSEGDPGRAWWYRRTVPFGDLGGHEQVVHFGAIDHTSDVWVDGEHVGHHQGGYTPVSVRLRGALASPGEHEIIVRAIDDPFELSQPRGKQSWDLTARSIWYPRTSGIWQPVWTERVASRSIGAISWRSSLPTSSLRLNVSFDGNVTGCGIAVRLFCNGRPLVDEEWAVASSRLDRWISLDRGAGDLGEEDILWHPRRPTLITGTVQLLDEDRHVIDEVETYAGMRSVGVEGDRLTLNGKPIEHRLVLDQGYWPETGMTPPSDEALRRDIELTQALGFNGVRKHQKVEDPRYLHWADRLGLLVWSELPSCYRFDDLAVQRVLREWPEMVLRDRGHPSVVGWIPFNESWGVREVADREDQRAHVRAVVDCTRALDPERPVIGNDGWEIVGGDIVAVHDYDLNPERLGERWASVQPEHLLGFGPLRRRLVLQDVDRPRPIMLSEFGGVSFSPEGWGYAKVDDAEEFLAWVEDLFRAVHSSTKIAGFCYTQLTDTYQETNGLLDVHRVPKVDLERLAAAVVGTSTGPPSWGWATNYAYVRKPPTES